MATVSFSVRRTFESLRSATATQSFSPSFRASEAFDDSGFVVVSRAMGDLVGPIERSRAIGASRPFNSHLTRERLPTSNAGDLAKSESIKIGIGVMLGAVGGIVGLAVIAIGIMLVWHRRSLMADVISYTVSSDRPMAKEKVVSVFDAAEGTVQTGIDFNVAWHDDSREDLFNATCDDT
jgi:hypothetical protein